jgi:FKBP-type peptidyl-prolyl cis-trans isomerase FkpA
MITTPSGLQYEDLTEGTGNAAKSGDSVQVHYTGWLTDGKKFDSSVGRGPFAFKLGAGSGMKVGGKRKLQIPAQLGYGSRGAASVIPPGAELIFEVELLAIR